VPRDLNVCSYCHIEIEPTFINPVRIELVTRDEEGEAVFYAHAACLTDHLPAEMSRYVEGFIADDVTPAEFREGGRAK
jgi:hypothetical protein